MPREVMTSALDVLGLLCLAAGAVAALLPLIGWAALAGGGMIILAGVRLADWLSRRPAREPRPRRTHVRTPTWSKFGRVA